MLTPGWKLCEVRSLSVQQAEELHDTTLTLQGGDELPIAAVTKHHKLHGLKYHKFIVLQFRGQKWEINWVKMKVLAGLCSFQRLYRIHFLAFSSFQRLSAFHVLMATSSFSKASSIASPHLSLALTFLPPSSTFKGALWVKGAQPNYPV